MGMLPLIPLLILQHRYVVASVLYSLPKCVAPKVVFSLNSAQEWKTDHTGINYPSFYNFVVNFLEEADNETTKASVDELLQWWNRYDFVSLLKI
jgi:hypothetical protein